MFIVNFPFHEGLFVEFQIPCKFKGCPSLEPAIIKYFPKLKASTAKSLSPSENVEYKFLLLSPEE